MLAYFTISAIGLTYLGLAIASLKSGRWYYLFIHPFSITCLYWLRIYRLRSEIPEIALQADFAIAVSVLVSAAAFFLAYRFFKESYIQMIVKKYDSLVRKNKKETDGPTYYTFWFFVIFIVVSLAAYYIPRYCLYGNWHDMFFEVYNRNSVMNIVGKESVTISFWSRLTLLISLYLNHALMYCGVVLMFECFRKRGTIRSLFSFWTGVIIAFLTCTSLMGLGFRTMPFNAAWVIVLLAIASMYVPSQRITKWSIPLIVFFLCYSLFAFLALYDTRALGVGSIAEVAQRFLSQDEAREKTKNQILAQREVQSFRPDPDFVIDLDLKSPHISSPTVPNNKSETEQSHISDDKSLHTERDYFLMEREFLLSNRGSYGWSTSRSIAWCMLWFGRHQEFVGFGNTQLATLVVPRKLFKIKPSDAYMDMARWGRPSGSALGPFGSGYIDYGLVGGYFNCFIWGIVCGLLAKIGMVLIFHDRTPLELHMVASGLAVSVPVVLGGGSAFLLSMLFGFAIIAVCYYTFLIVLNFCGRFSTSVARDADE